MALIYFNATGECYYRLTKRLKNQFLPIDALAYEHMPAIDYEKFSQIHPGAKYFPVDIHYTGILSLPKDIRKNIGLSDELHDYLVVIENVGFKTKAYYMCRDFFMRQPNVENMMHTFDWSEYIMNHINMDKSNDSNNGYWNHHLYIYYLDNIRGHSVGYICQNRPMHYDIYLNRKKAGLVP